MEIITKASTALGYSEIEIEAIEKFKKEGV
jgi:hypothetical protein